MPVAVNEHACGVSHLATGVVYKCQHKVTGRIVAIKQMRDDDKNEQVREGPPTNA
jgi:hypothetical protein